MPVGGKTTRPSLGTRKRTPVKPIISGQCHFPRAGGDLANLVCRWGEALPRGQAQELSVSRAGSRSEHEAGSESGSSSSG